MKQHELLWTEVTASNLRKVDMNDDLDERSGVNRPGFTLHGGVLKGRPDVNCAVHIHTETGMALAGLKHGLRMISQQAMRFPTASSFGNASAASASLTIITFSAPRRSARTPSSSA